MKVFVTGIDTGIGKTHVCAHYLNQWASQRPAYYKPIQTGSPSREQAEDVLTVQSLTGRQGDPTISCGLCLKAPLSPYQASKLDAQILMPETILADLHRVIAKHDWLVVEGAGGVLVPITQTFFMIDLIEASGLPVIVVTHPRLGTLNHTLLTLSALQQRHIPIQGFVMNPFPASPSLADADIITMIETLSGVSCLFVLDEPSL